jgi:hypothetical protein
MPTAEALAGVPALPVVVTVEHACGHRWRWHFFHDQPAVLVVAGKAAILCCPRCGPRPELDEPGDVSYWPTGICHAHDGPCPDSPHARWLDGVGCRFRPERLTS